ncbi:MAG: acyloxyacyl hydrolase [Bacteroidia bacterium]
MRLLFCLIGFVMVGQSTLQSQAPFYVGAEWGRSTTFRHRPEKMPFSIDQQAGFFAVRAMWETNDQRYWQKTHRQPRIGATIMAQRYGNDSILGWSYGLMPEIDFWIYRSKRLALFFRGGFGLTFVTKPYRRGTNERNTAIGTTVNNMTSVALGGEYHAGRITLGLTARAIHTSNGRFSTPNLGLNMAGWGLNASYRLGGDSRPILSKTKQEYHKTWKPGLRLGFAGHEIGAAGGPRFPVQILSAFVIRPLSPKFRLWLQAEASHQSGARPYGFRNPPRRDLVPAEWAWRYSVGAGGELLMGRVGFTMQYMIYLDPPFSNPEYFAVKIGPIVYLTPPDKALKKPNLFLGTFLKAHQAVAQYIEVTGGVIF